MWFSFSRRSRSVPPLHKAARPGTRDSVSRCSVALHTASHRLAKRNRYVTLRSLFMSGLDAPVSPCLQFRQRLPSAGPTLTWECQSNTALLPGQCQSRKDRYLSLQLLYVRLLPRPTALPPMPFVSGHSHGCSRRCIRPQTA